MKWSEYQNEARKTIVFPLQYAPSYLYNGVNGEAGELCGKLKKLLRDHDGKATPEYMNSILNELGDICWYVAIWHDLFNFFIDVSPDNVDILIGVAAADTVSGAGKGYQYDMHDTKRLVKACANLSDNPMRDSFCRLVEALSHTAAVIGVDLSSVLKMNADRLKDRQDRNVLHGDGDNR